MFSLRIRFAIAIVSMTLVACSLVTTFDGLVGTSAAADAQSDAATDSARDAGPGAPRFCDQVHDAAFCVDFEDDAGPSALGTTDISAAPENDGGPVGAVRVVESTDAPSGLRVLRVSFDQFVAAPAPGIQFPLFNALVTGRRGAFQHVRFEFKARVTVASPPANPTDMQLAYAETAGVGVAAILRHARDVGGSVGPVNGAGSAVTLAPSPPLGVFLAYSMELDVSKAVARLSVGEATISTALPPADAGDSAFSLGLRDYGFATTVPMTVDYDDVVMWAE